MSFGYPALARLLARHSTIDGQAHNSVDANLIRSMYDYNRWANDRVLQASAQLSPEMFTRELGSSFSSVRDTLAHILAAEWIWLERWNGRSSKSLLKATDFSSVESLRRKWSEVDGALSHFISTLGDSQLASDIEYTNLKGQQFSYSLGQQMIHVVNHSTYHRGQVTTLLRQLKADVLSTDLLLYYDEKK